MTNQNETQHVSRARWVFYGFLAIAGFLLFTEHRAHLLGILPYLLLLACPLMHMFMHRGHNNAGHNNHGHNNNGRHAHNHESSKGESK